MSKELFAIPSILTTSLRELLPFYGDKIIEIDAEGGDSPAKPVILDRDYGVTHRVSNTGNVVVAYRQSRDPVSAKPMNPMTLKAIKRVFGFLDEHLKPYADIAPDIPVSRILIEVENKEIAKLTGKSSVFDVLFESNAPEPSTRKSMTGAAGTDLSERLEKHWLPRVKGFGFKYRNLNLVGIQETVERMTKPKAEWDKVVSWEGYPSTAIKTNRLVAQVIRWKYLPEDFAQLKLYYLSLAQELMLDGVI